jgi:hypothetical protein
VQPALGRNDRTVCRMHPVHQQTPVWHRNARAWREQLMSVLRRTAEIAALAQRGAEAAFLVRLLTAHHLGRLAAHLPPDTQQVGAWA